MIRDSSSDEGSPATIVRKYLKLDHEAEREIEANKLLSDSPYTVKATLHLEFDETRPPIKIQDLKGRTYKLERYQLLEFKFLKHGTLLDLYMKANN
jgi:hypothetical protein